MARLIYMAIASLDGFIEDASGGFGWAQPDEEVHSFVNELVRPVGTYLYGRRMYETMAYWERPPGLDEEPPVVRDFAAIWQAADKVVFSRTLAAASTARTRVERAFDADAIRALKAGSGDDIGIGGPELAGQAVASGLVDELQLFLVPVIVGTGKRWLPEVEVRSGLGLLDDRHFANGTVFLRYRARP